MACNCELYTSGTHALIRMIVTTSNPKKSLRLIRTKELIMGPLRENKTKRIKTEKARKRQLNWFEHGESARDHVVIAYSE